LPHFFGLPWAFLAFSESSLALNYFYRGYKAE
jgi:hypothetical protein